MQHFAVFLLDKRSFVSGSNSRFLSSDVVTELRGRGDEIRIWPLTFDEYFNGIGGDIRKAWLDYYTFGGLPQVALLETEEKKTDYLRGLYETTYLRDVIERNHLRNPEGMKELVRVIASGIGSSTNPTRIANTFQTVQGVTIKRDTIKQYIDYLKDSFLIEEALRYDVKGRKYMVPRRNTTSLMSAYVQPFSTIDSRKKRTLWKTLSIMSFAVEDIMWT